MVAPRHESQPLTEKLFNESVEKKKARRPRKDMTGSLFRQRKLLAGPLQPSSADPLNPEKSKLKAPKFSDKAPNSTTQQVSRNAAYKGIIVEVLSTYRSYIRTEYSVVRWQKLRGYMRKHVKVASPTTPRIL